MESVLRVVSVDDNPLDSKILERFLKRLTPDELAFASYEDPDVAVAELPGDDPDVIFLDFNLGARNGLDVLRELVDSGVSAPIVFLTGGVSEEAAAEALRAGAAGYMLKSGVGGEELKRALDEALAAAQERRGGHSEEESVADVPEIERFYHSISHEIKTPLTACQEFLSIVLDEIPGPLNSEQREYLQIAANGHRRIKRIIDDIMESTMLELDEVELRPERRSLRQIIESAIADTRVSALDGGVTVEFADPEGDPELLVDAHWLRRALIQVIDNAIKFGGEDRKVEIRLVDHGSECTIGVSDEGPGINPARVGVIFDRLVQLTEDDPALSPGMGLGLYIAQQVIALHGGEISVISGAGRGSEFTVHLPRGGAETEDR